MNRILLVKESTVDHIRGNTFTQKTSYQTLAEYPDDGETRVALTRDEIQEWYDLGVAEGIYIGQERKDSARRCSMESQTDMAKLFGSDK